MLSTAGSGVIALAMLVFIANLWVSLRRRRPAGNDPWEGHTLEWWTTLAAAAAQLHRPAADRLVQPRCSTCGWRRSG